MPEKNVIKQEETSKKKISLKEAIQKQLEAKKNKTTNHNIKGSPTQSAKKMQSQQAKKVNSAPRKMGS